MREYGDNLEGGGNMVILVYPNVRNVVVSGQWENNCSNNVPDVLINTQIINTFTSGVRECIILKHILFLHNKSESVLEP